MPLPGALARIAVPALLATSLALPARDAAADPLIIPDTQLEPLGWSALDGWNADDHIAAFATFLDSCGPYLSVRRPRDPRPVYGALWSVCRLAVRLRPETDPEAQAFFEENFQAVAIARIGKSKGLLTRDAAVMDGSRFPSPEFSTPLYRRPRDLLVDGRPPPHGQVPPGGHQPAQREQPARPLSRSRRHRGRRARRPEARNLLAQESVRCADDPDPGIGAHQLEDGTVLRVNYDAHNGHPYAAVGRIPDRAVRHPGQPDVDGAHPPMDGGQSRRGPQGTGAQCLVRVLPHHRPVRPGRGGGRPGRAADARAFHRGRPDACLRHAVLHHGRSAGGQRQAGDQVPAVDDRAGHRLGDSRTGTRRSLLGGGDRAGRIAGRIRQQGQFVMLLPRELDLVEAGRQMPLPPPRPAPVVAQAKPEVGRVATTQKPVPVEEPARPIEPTVKPPPRRPREPIYRRQPRYRTRVWQ